MSIYSNICSLRNLNIAWDRVRRNKPSSGVDGITCEQFHENRKQEIAALARELENHEYQTLPVRQVTIYKGEKAREIALYCMRDKVVQQSLAAVLNELFDPMFSESAAAYRNGKSALSAVGEIDRQIRENHAGYFIKGDIEKFFDHIQWKKLKPMLEKYIREEDVIELIRMNSCGRWLDEKTGDIEERSVGIFQGSGIAPVLSNIYLMEFDSWASQQNSFYIRYSDDMIILENQPDLAAETLQQITSRMSSMGLSLNERKTILGEVKDGFEFLGYAFNEEGKTIPEKAERNLESRLETMWFTSGDIGFSAKCKKAMEIIGGWEQYFTEGRQAASILEYAALVYAANRDSSKLAALQEQRPQLQNCYRDVCDFLAQTWRNCEREDLELGEYEQFYEIPGERTDAASTQIGTAQWQELLSGYRRFFAYEETDTAIELMQLYTDMQQYDKAETWHEKIKLLKQRTPVLPSVFQKGPTGGVVLQFGEDSAIKVLKLFAGREDMYGTESLQQQKARIVEHEARPLTEEVIRDHLNGKTNVDTYIQRPNATVHTIVFDVDVSRKILLQGGRDQDIFQAALRAALGFAAEIVRQLRTMGINGYIEYSGCRGYHVWIFLEEWMPVRYANMLTDLIETKLSGSIPNDITLEIFPNKTRVKQGKPGQRIKIPFGFHVRSGERTYFLNEEMLPVTKIDPFLDSIARTSAGTIRKVLAVHSGEGTQAPSDGRKFQPETERFGDLPSSVKAVLDHCALMYYLCTKSMDTGYLTHFERLSVLYVFGHLGDQGKEFVHQVMSYTLNYDHGVTERFIRKCPEKPISCVKLRDQYKTITAEYGCSCIFKGKRQCYPSPVLHAVTLAPEGEEEITLPIGRTVTKQKEKEMISQMNTGSRASELIKELVELRKQQRKLKQEADKREAELDSIFDTANTDSMETELGRLVRKKKEDGSREWVIEI